MLAKKKKNCRANQANANRNKPQIALCQFVLCFFDKKPRKKKTEKTANKIVIRIEKYVLSVGFSWGIGLAISIEVNNRCFEFSHWKKSKFRHHWKFMLLNLLFHNFQLKHISKYQLKDLRSKFCSHRKYFSREIIPTIMNNCEEILCEVGNTIHNPYLVYPIYCANLK